MVDEGVGLRRGVSVLGVDGGSVSASSVDRFHGSLRTMFVVWDVVMVFVGRSERWWVGGREVHEPGSGVGHTLASLFGCTLREEYD